MKHRFTFFRIMCVLLLFPGFLYARVVIDEMDDSTSSCTNSQPVTRIHTIQGNSGASSEVGKIHSIEGVVVGDFQDTKTGLKGFFIQEETKNFDDDPTTSEGIFVYNNGFGKVNVGDLVRVKGQVTEYYNLTTLSNITQLSVCGQGSTSAVTVNMPVENLDQWENYEGMLINIPQTLYATGNYNQGQRGEVILSVGGRLDNPTNVVLPGQEAIDLLAGNNLRRIQLDDGSNVSNPLPLPPYLGEDNTLRAGDTLEEITGVLGYSYGTWEIHPTMPVEFTRMNMRTALPVDVGGSLKVASFNVLNYFNGDGFGGGFPGPRGAKTLEEFNRQRDKIISAILAMDADVIGLMEVENDISPDSALEDLVSGLNGVVGDGVYGFIDTKQVGTDAIRVAFIYKPAAVEPVGEYAVLDSFVDPRFIDTKNRPALAQSFKEIASGGVFTLCVNHFKSKGSNCDVLEDPDIGDGQGNCNITRTEAAKALVDWLKTDPTKVDDPDYLIIGDLNSYAKEDPVTAIKAGGYLNLMEEFGGDDYSYVFDGQKGALDHALASESLIAQVTGVIHWHINTDEPRALDYNDFNQPDLYDPGPYRASDHDPVLIGLELKGVKTLCSTLGNNHGRGKWFVDRDIFKFSGKKDELVSINLIADPLEAFHGKSANLVLVDHIRKQWFLKKDKGELPNHISAVLPADGDYYLIVGELYGSKDKNLSAYEGNYCLSLSAFRKTADSLEATDWVE
ncbi:MAG: ExeM/NucH family extracellular endonuclease [Desulfobacteraceae bacterium]|nr:ExeM/NucH family extracellular endonuclease [Desulfobacteraceae bacterium]